MDENERNLIVRAKNIIWHLLDDDIRSFSRQRMICIWFLIASLILSYPLIYSVIHAIWVMTLMILALEFYFIWMIFEKIKLKKKLTGEMKKKRAFLEECLRLLGESDDSESDDSESVDSESDD